MLPAAAQVQVLSEADYQRLVELRSPIIAPDGKRAVVLVTRILWDEDKRTTDLVAVDLAGGTQQTLVSHREGLSDPAFSPDGSALAFLAEDGTGKDAHAQIFVMPAASGVAHAVTHGKADIEQFAWSPDGRSFAFAAADPDPQRNGSDRFRDSFIFTTEPIVARDFPRPVHLFTVPLDGGTPAQLTFGPQSVATGEAQSTLSWSPNGNSIAFTLVPNAILNDESYSRVAVLDVATRSVRTITGRTAWEVDPWFSPDGAHIAYSCAKGDTQVNLSELCVTSPQGGVGSRVSASIDRPIGDAAWLGDSKSLLFVAPDRASVALYRISLTGRSDRLDTDGINISSPLQGATAPDGSLVFVGSSTTRPAELFIRSADGQTKRLTNFNAAISNLSLASAERITFPTSTGITGDAVLYRPPGYEPGKRYPLVVFIHGGPTSSSMLSFSFWAQLMAVRGWLVLQPNYRGSDDLGLTYQHAVLYDPEDGPGKDIMAAVKVVRGRGIVDTSRIAVCGWSYGGIMTAWMISKYHIWRAAVSGASVDDWITDYGTADDSLADVDLFHGSPFVGANAAEWRRASAISYVADVTTPVLILSDVGDNRDSFATSSMYWRALRDNHKDATLRVWPVNGHSPHDPVRLADVYHYWIDYIAEHFR
ncbi:MAG TPA: S9 family peptidase [Candidatus Cybelea sp.]|jgi:dipeptidyl aminopeptidase/acylaminoacyl peptidase|nr:S9 family peptidase [Candidatus Cybelea sp.]